MNTFLQELLEEYSGIDIQSLESLCSVFDGFLDSTEVDLQSLDYDEFVAAFLWAVQMKLEREYYLVHTLVGVTAAESEYYEDLDFMYLIFNSYHNSITFNMPALEGYFGDDLVEDYMERFNKLIDSLNNSTSLKFLKISGNHTA